MEESFLLDLILSEKLDEYRDELEKVDDDNLSKWVSEAREELEKSVDKEQLKLVDHYIFDIKLREEFIDFQVGVRLLNYGVKIGMQLQKAFKEME